MDAGIMVDYHKKCDHRFYTIHSYSFYEKIPTPLNYKMVGTVCDINLSIIHLKERCFIMGTLSPAN
jgi:hypothetical protein